jgi:hypothetical protein
MNECVVGKYINVCHQYLIMKGDTLLDWAKIILPVEVVNLKTCKNFGVLDGDILIDRRTKWGNPFKISKTCDRAESIKKYEEYFVKKLLKDLDEIKHARRLGCWCKPLECHGDVIKRYLEERG